MTDTGMTTKNVKRYNRKKVYQYIYDQGTTSKLSITQSLQMGLSTVTQNLKLLEEDGLICRNGSFQSTGGRKADVLQIQPMARLSIGIALLKDYLHLLVADLYGNAQYTQAIPLKFQADPTYYAQVGEHLQVFLAEHQVDASRVLGVSIAVQGILSLDGEGISYGTILGNMEMKIADFTPYIPFPCRFEHDSKAAAQLELWRNRSLTQGVVLLLNRNFGGAVVASSQVQQGLHRRSGTVEHMTINQHGPLCYCGKRGCLETYCSAAALENNSGVDIETFFLEKPKNPQFQVIWEDYLTYLGVAMGNLAVILDGTFVLSGYLAPYLTPKDLSFLLEKTNQATTFPLTLDDFVVGTHGEFTQALGGALHYLQEFLEDM